MAPLYPPPSACVQLFGSTVDKKECQRLHAPARLAAVRSGGNSHIIHVLPGEDFLSNVILCSPVLVEDQESVIAAAGFEFGVDPNVDPELALAFQVSIEEERARQEDAAEESSETKSTGQSLTSNDDIVMADAESEPNPYTEDKRNLQTAKKQRKKHKKKQHKKREE